jgi:hypothetical protein
MSDEMDKDQDQRIVDILQAHAPARRDPVFRISVLERREHRRFQRRIFALLAGALAIILVWSFALRFGADELGIMGTLAIGAALASSYFAFRRGLPHVLRRFSI